AHRFHVQVVRHKVHQQKQKQALGQLHRPGLPDQFDHLIDQHRHNRNVHKVPYADCPDCTDDLVPFTYHRHHPSSSSPFFLSESSLSRKERRRLTRRRAVGRRSLSSIVSYFGVQSNRHSKNFKSRGKFLRFFLSCSPENILCRRTECLRLRRGVEGAQT